MHFHIMKGKYAGDGKPSLWESYKPAYSTMVNLFRYPPSEEVGSPLKSRAFFGRVICKNLLRGRSGPHLWLGRWCHRAGAGIRVRRGRVAGRGRSAATEVGPDPFALPVDL